METQLTINDIKAVVSLIDIMTERGALKGQELSGVAQMREKFVAFVEAQAKVAADAEEVSDMPDAEDTDQSE